MTDWRIVLVACASFWSQTACAQSQLSGLSGIVLGPDGAAVPDAPIRAVSAATGSDARAYSSADGRYEMRNLPGGAYTVSVGMQCCAFAPYTNADVVLEAGQALRLDIRLEEGGSLNVLGDDPGTVGEELRNRQPVPDGSVPRMADGKPDFSGH